MCAIDITAEQRKTVLALLARHLPNTTAWVYGSRVKWTARPESDLDLVVFANSGAGAAGFPISGKPLRKATCPSGWTCSCGTTVPEQFRKTIEAEHVVLVEKEEQKTARDWHETTLGGLLSFANGKSSPRRSDGLPHAVYGSNGIIGFSDETNADPNTIVVGRVGTYCGSLHYSNRICWVTDNAIRSTAINRNDAKFLFYLLQTLRLNEWRAGSGQPLLNQTILSSIHVAVPDPTEQRAIAHILGTLDDKIELNRRMNQTLEEMARALFKSWFVGFDPVRAKATLKHHEATPPQGGSDWSVERARAYLDRVDPNIAAVFPNHFVDSELGPIPEGWEVGTLGSLAVVSSGKRPSIRYPTASSRASIPLWGGNGPMAFVPEALVDYPILLTGRVGTLGSVFRITSPCFPSDNTLILRAKCKSSFDYLRFSLEMVDFDALNRGSTQPLLTRGDLQAQPIVLPPVIVLAYFNRCTSFIFEEIDGRDRESLTLTALRDVLLPKLISGEVGVKDEVRH